MVDRAAYLPVLAVFRVLVLGADPHPGEKCFGGSRTPIRPRQHYLRFSWLWAPTPIRANVFGGCRTRLRLRQRYPRFAVVFVLFFFERERADIKEEKGQTGAWMVGWTDRETR